MIDAALPLGATTQPNTLGMIGQLQKLGLNQGDLAAQQQQAQLGDQKIQANDYSLAQAGQEAQDNTDIRAATAAATNPQTGQLDKPTLISTLAKLNPSAAARTASSFATQDAAAQEAAQKLQQAKLQTATDTNNAMDKVLQGVVDQPSYTNALQHAQSLGINVSQFPPQYDPQVVARAHQQVLSTQQILAQKNAEATQAENARKDTATEANTAASLANTQANQKAERALEQQRVNIEGGHLALDRQNASIANSVSSNLTGDAYLQTLPPGMQSQVKAMANGDVPLPPPGTRSPQAQALRNAVFSYDPSVTQARYQGKQNFLTKGDATSVQQLGTTILHADNALNNSGKMGFAPMQGTPFQAAADAPYRTDADFLTGEVGKFVTGGQLTVDEGKKLSTNLYSARQDVRDAAINEMLSLAGGKMSAKTEGYKAATGQDFPVGQFFNDPKIIGALQKHGIVDGQPATQSAAPAVGVGAVVMQNGHRYKVTAVGKDGKPTAADPVP